MFEGKKETHESLINFPKKFKASNRQPASQHTANQQEHSQPVRQKVTGPDTGHTHTNIEIYIEMAYNASTPVILVSLSQEHAGCSARKQESTI